MMNKKVSKRNEDFLASLDGYIKNTYGNESPILDYGVEIDLSDFVPYEDPEDSPADSLLCGHLFPEAYVVPELVGKFALNHPFVDYLIELLIRDGRNGRDLYGDREDYMSRQTLSKLLQGKSISKDNILKLSIMLRLTESETIKLLNSAGFGTNKGIKRDLIVMFAIEHKIYDPYEIDDTLDSYGEKTLFNKC